MQEQHDIRNMVLYSPFCLNRIFFNLLPHGTNVYLSAIWICWEMAWTVFVCEITPVSAFTLACHLT